jgi:ribose 5-phosphate isomerase B
MLGMRIALAADHAGYLLKDELVAWLREAGHDVSDLGTNGPESVDYPQFGPSSPKQLPGVRRTGIAIAARDRHFHCGQPQSPVAARVDEPLSAALAREHNDANVLRSAPPDRQRHGQGLRYDLPQQPFAGGRHQRRVDQLSKLLQDSD